MFGNRSVYDMLGSPARIFPLSDTMTRVDITLKKAVDLIEWKSLAFSHIPDTTR